MKAPQTWAEVDAAMTRAWEEIRAQLESEYLSDPWPFASHDDRWWYLYRATPEEQTLFCQCGVTYEDFCARATTWNPSPIERARDRLLPEFTD